MNALEESEVDRLTKIREKLARKVTELNIVASNPGRRSLISARTVRTEDSYSHKRISDLATFQDIGDALIPGVRLDTLSESENVVRLPRAPLPPGKGTMTHPGISVEKWFRLSPTLSLLPDGEVQCKMHFSWVIKKKNYKIRRYKKNTNKIKYNIHMKNPHK